MEGAGGKRERMTLRGLVSFLQKIVRLILVQLGLIIVQSRVSRTQTCSSDRRGLGEQQRWYLVQWGKE